MDVQSLELRIKQNAEAARELVQLRRAMLAEYQQRDAAVAQRIETHISIAADAKAAIRNRELAMRRMQKVRQL